MRVCGIARTLRKTSSGVHFTYTTGGFTNNLLGEFFRLLPGTVDGAPWGFEFDLSKNLRSRNKEVNSYLDAKEYGEGEWNELQMLQFYDEQVIASLVDILKEEISCEFRLLIKLPPYGGFEYRSQVENLGHDFIQFAVRKVCGKARTLGGEEA